MDHITTAIQAIRAMPGPAEGLLIVALISKGNNEGWGHYSPDEAIAIIRDNPGIEFEALEKWYLY